MPSPTRDLSPDEALGCGIGSCPMWQLARSQNRNINNCRCEGSTYAGQPLPVIAEVQDLKERIYVAFKVLERSGQGKQDAYCTVADLAASYLGKSRRGRPTRGERDLFSKMKTVASLVSRFRQDPGAAENLVDFRIGQFIWLRKAGIVCGSEYVENSGQKMHEAWRDAVGSVLFKPFTSIGR